MEPLDREASIVLATELQAVLRFSRYPGKLTVHLAKLFHDIEIGVLCHLAQDGGSMVGDPDVVVLAGFLIL